MSFPVGNQMNWDDEIIVSWLQKYPGIKQPLQTILVRRYKNLLYKEIARQCDQRYDREEIVQQIGYLFLQLLEEYDGERGIPLAGFLKKKLPNRIYNYFKSQVRVWNAEVLHDSFYTSKDDDDIFETKKENRLNDNYEVTQTNSEVYEFWVEIAKILDRKKFEALFWKFQCDYTNDEIAILLGKSGPCEVEKFIGSIVEVLKFDKRAFNEHSFNLAKTNKQPNTQKKHIDTNYHLFQLLHHTITSYCGVLDWGCNTLNQYNTMCEIFSRGQDMIIIDFILTAQDIIERCNLSISADK